MFALFGKVLIFIGFFLILIGIFFLFGSKIPYFGKLPGDIYIKSGNFTPLEGPVRKGGDDINKRNIILGRG